MIRFDPVATYAACYPNGAAVADLESGRRWSYAELDRAVDRLAAWLCGEFGPNSGVRLATLAHNCAQILILQLASIRAGTIFVPLNWRLAPAEIDQLAADAEPAIVFNAAEFAPPAAIPRSMPIAGDAVARLSGCPPATGGSPAIRRGCHPPLHLWNQWAPERSHAI